MAEIPDHLAQALVQTGAKVEAARADCEAAEKRLDGARRANHAAQDAFGEAVAKLVADAIAAEDWMYAGPPG